MFCEAEAANRIDMIVSGRTRRKSVTEAVQATQSLQSSMARDFPLWGRQPWQLHQSLTRYASKIRCDRCCTQECHMLVLQESALCARAIHYCQRALRFVYARCEFKDTATHVTVAGYCCRHESAMWACASRWRHARVLLQDPSAQSAVHPLRTRNAL